MVSSDVQSVKMLITDASADLPPSEDDERES